MLVGGLGVSLRNARIASSELHLKPSLILFNTLMLPVTIVHIYIYIYTRTYSIYYIYIYIHRERERETYIYIYIHAALPLPSTGQPQVCIDRPVCAKQYNYIYIYIYIHIYIYIYISQTHLARSRLDTCCYNGLLYSTSHFSRPPRPGNNI